MRLFLEFIFIILLFFYIQVFEKKKSPEPLFICIDTLSFFQAPLKNLHKKYNLDLDIKK